jgi:hypothetical protein
MDVERAGARSRGRLHDEDALLGVVLLGERGGSGLWGRREHGERVRRGRVRVLGDGVHLCGGRRRRGLVRLDAGAGVQCGRVELRPELHGYVVRGLVRQLV